MAKTENGVLEGTTLSVYIYIAKQKKPVGPREVTRSLNLNSPSVAYRHLQKLENAKLIEKNEYGEYFFKQKTKINGYHWVGRNLWPNSIFYFCYFLALFIVEIIVLAIHYDVETYEFKIFFLIGLTITGIAMVLFLLEGMSSMREIRKASTSPD